MPSEIASLFDTIRAIYSKHEFNLYTPWQSWSSLNEFYPSPKSLGIGYFIQTNETNHFERFASINGSHPVLGSHVQGNNKAAFKELSEALKLELVLDIDGENMLTYKGKRIRYWKINA